MLGVKDQLASMALQASLGVAICVGWRIGRDRFHDGFVKFDGEA